MSLTLVVKARSVVVMTRAFMSLTGKPVNDQMTLTTGMLTSGKMSVGVRTMATAPSSTMSSTTNTNVYGRRSASVTIHTTLTLLSWLHATIRLHSRMPPSTAPPASSHTGFTRVVSMPAAVPSAISHNRQSGA